MRSQSGFSLIELMVALGLGLVVSAAGLQIFLSSSLTSSFQRSLSEVQTTGRISMDQLVGDLRLAGLPPSNAKAPAPFALFVANTPGLPDTSTKISSDNTQTDAFGNSSSDQLVIQYYAPSNTTTDCEGNAVAEGALVINRYFLRLDTDSQSYSLACDGGNNNGTLNNYAPTDTGLVLMTGVDSFQVLYGIDDGTPTPQGATLPVKQPVIARYVTAAQYTALTAPRPEILAVRVGLLVRTQDRAAGPEASLPASNIWVLDRQLQVNDAATAAVLSDGRIRRVFTSTIALRNVDLSGV